MDELVSRKTTSVTVVDKGIENQTTDIINSYTVLFSTRLEETLWFTKR